ncbi:MAG TPA: PD-(D/E)XK nuclease family protein [Casimicrobiaceae bacterium]|nr:PD-(D/E)XK nuclease family protein [Casimicrobiaceae bacterium]
MLDSTLDPLLEAALARGAMIVTPNKRLARDIASRHDRAHARRGERAWAAARALPWHSFVDSLLTGALDAGVPAPAHRLSIAQAAQIWRTVVDRDGDAPLVDIDDVAALAARAWEIVHAYGGTAEGWRGLDTGGADTEGFVRWAGSFVRETGALDAIDVARVADVVADHANALPDVGKLDLAFVAFAEVSPQQRRLTDALRDAGARLEFIDSTTTVNDASTVSATARLAELATPRDELVAAFDWARAQATRNPSAEIGIVVPDLAQRRAFVRSLAEDRLCPGLQLPGRESAPRPYDLSLGTALSDVPLVATAMDAIALAHQPLEQGRVVALLRSLYLPDAAERWSARASSQRRWLEEGRSTLTFDDLVEALARVDVSLASRWNRLRQNMRMPAHATPRAWAEHWRSWLDGVGFAEDRSLDSAEFQAQGAFNDLLGTFASLSLVARTFSRADALSSLQRLARETIHQPESRGARIRILGVLEARGLSFDALWVSGMSADAWPRAPAANSLLPIRWQRERNVPRSSPALELAFAQRQTALFSRAAREVVFSFSAQLDEHARAASPLIDALPRLELSASLLTPQRLFDGRPPLQSVDDRLAPVVAEGTSMRGGAGVVESQSACPFQAMARHRLRADEWPAPVLGIEPRERGSLMHAALAAFWNETRDHASLMALSASALEQRIREAIHQARATIREARWRSIPAAIAESEIACLERVLHEWLAIEQQRAPFTVVGTELRTPLSMAGLTLDVRLDRIDAIAGGLAVIDYKSGRAPPVAKWFDERPQGTQLATYAAAYAQRASTEPVRALFYARLKRGEVGTVGIARDDAFGDALDAPPDVRLDGPSLTDWDDALARLLATTTRLAQDFAAGQANVAPRDRSVCKNCNLPALCRIGSAPTGDDEARFEAGDDE